MEDVMKDYEVTIVKAHQAHDHADLLRQLGQLRYKIFVELKGWQLTEAHDGIEQDSFDNDRATYVVLTTGAKERRIIASLRLHDTAGGSLLTDVFPHLVDGEIPRASDVWEATRLMTHPDLSPAESRKAISALLALTVSYGLTAGIRYFVSVSDPILERVLRRCGLAPRRLGQLKEVQPGIRALALKIPCTVEAFCEAAARTRGIMAPEDQRGLAA
jgi:N-acyl-L-homoserine lactone synthetase